jgi:hypothetical protein
MASIYVHDGVQALTLQIRGELTHGAAIELEQAWLTARSTLAGRGLVVDLSALVSAEGTGRAVLDRLASDGAMFITASSLTEALAEELSRRSPKLLPSARAGVWDRLACCIKTVCGRTKTSLKRTFPCGRIVRRIW